MAALAVLVLAAFIPVLSTAEPSVASPVGVTTAGPGPRAARPPTTDNATDQDLVNADVAHRLTYNAGDLLNMPSFTTPRWHISGRKGQGRTGELRAAMAARVPDSVVGMYFGSALLRETACDHFTPYLPRLFEALYRYAAARNASQAARAVEAQARRNDTLVVHLRLGDRGPLGAAFYRRACDVAGPFARVILVTAIHNHTAVQPLHYSVSITKQGIARMRQALRQCAPRARLHVHLSRSPDADLVLMQQARHLLVSTGGFSMLGALVCAGTVYASACAASWVRNPRFRLQVPRLRYEPFKELGAHAARFDRVGPVAPACCNPGLLSLRTGVVLMHHCSNLVALRAPCWVASIDYPETADSHIRLRKCEVHVLRLVGGGVLHQRLPAVEPTRHQRLPAVEPMRPLALARFEWAPIAANLSARYGLPPAPGHVRVAVVGQEAEVLRAILAAPETTRPAQITFPLCVSNASGPQSYGPEDFVPLLARLRRCGYYLALREDLKQGSLNNASHAGPCTSLTVVHNRSSLKVNARRAVLPSAIPRHFRDRQALAEMIERQRATLRD